jgi:hypothetical protein
MMLLPLSAALLGPFAARLVLGVSLNPRYFQSAVPVVLVLLAVGASAEGAWQLLTRGAGVAVGVLFVAATAMHFAPSRGTVARMSWAQAPGSTRTCRGTSPCS